jgi:mono/diheme cytochrome c family protein
MLKHSVSLATGALIALFYGQFATAEDLTFEQHVRPIFKAYCFDCHGGGEKLEGNLDLRLARFAAKGGDSGAALVVGKPAESLLVARLKSGEMPPVGKKVPAEQIAVIEAWIAAGAKTTRNEPERLPAGIDITPEERAYWFYQPLSEPAVPQFPAEARVRSPIDAFLLARMREQQLAFAPDADKRTLLLRAALDLTGLPPTPEQLDQFLADTSEQAYESALDRLLESPHYGERWGRHWLDVAGYADSDGDGTTDTVRPYAYKYRDYVIRALNADKPLDQFITDQLAGDELAPPPWNNLTPEQIEKLAATGFLRTAIDATQGTANEQEAANQVVADTLKIVSSSLLGLSVGCAQCHDHRYDPIPHTDYFRFRAIFAPALDTAHWRRPSQRLVSLYTDADRAKAAVIDAEAAKLQEALNAKTQQFLTVALEKELLKFPEDQRAKLREAYNAPADKRTEEQKQLLASNPSVNLSAGVLYQYDQAAADELKKDAEKVAAKRAEKPVEDFISVLSEVPGVIPPTHLLHRGDYRQPKQEVTPGDLTIAAPEGARLEIPAKDPALATSGRRLAYARHLTSGKHPLVGRVLANRIWHHHFGRGIVDSPGDFGILGTRPSHPELLDWLAGELVRQGWSLKGMHRLIMTSTAYRQASRRSAEALAADSENRLLSHFPLQRLDAESLRDRMLLAAGRLDRTPFGPPVPVEEDFVGQVLPAGDSARRSVYLQVRRTKPVSFLTAFDAPVMMVNCERRVPSTSAPQSLMLMNSEFVLAQATVMATRLKQETTIDFARELAAPLAATYQRTSEAWQFGYGSYDEASQRTASFAPLPHWTGSSWQGGAALPDPQVGWVIVHAAGGHTGANPSHATIRRWTAPAKGTLAISGKLQHASENGDGVRGRIVSSKSGLAGQWPVKNGEAATDAAALAVEPGDTLDFVVDCIGDVTSDSFTWAVDLKLLDAASQPLGTWNSATDFHGPAVPALPQLVANAWRLAYHRLPSSEELAAACAFVQAQRETLRAAATAGDHEQLALTSLCQQLFSSNEFLYVE